MSNSKVLFVVIGLVVLLMTLTAFVTWAATAHHIQSASLNDTLVKPNEAWLIKHGDGIDSRQSFSVASIINEMRKAAEQTSVQIQAEVKKAIADKKED